MPHLASTLAGIALGDALGLPHEGLSAGRVAKRLGGKPPRPALLPGLMMVSDDTDHAAMTLGAWRDGGGDPNRFARNLAWRLRWWFTALPPGMGLATAKASIRLWLGMPPSRSGVASAGNGPLMRAAILGVVLRDDAQLRSKAVDISSRLTHTDERALDSARILAEACACLATSGRPTDERAFCNELATHATTPEVLQVLHALALGPATGESIADFLFARVLARASNFNGAPTRAVSGYAPESLAAALAAFLHGGPDACATIHTAITFGGDTDSVASFAGALAGAADPCAFENPKATLLLTRIVDTPWSAATLKSLASGARPSPIRIALRPLRNLFQLIVVLVHCLLRPLT